MYFNVSHEFSLSKSPSIIQPLYPSFKVCCNVLDSDEVHGIVLQCFTGVQFSHMGLYHLVFVPSIETWSRLIMRKEQIVAPDHEIEREATLYRYIRELKPFKKMSSRLNG